MQHLFLNRELSQLAKEKGFDEKCLFSYQDGELCSNFVCGCEAAEVIEAPLYQQIVDWFREKHRIAVYADEAVDFSCFIPRVYKADDRNWRFTGAEYIKYYKALDKAITEAFKLV